MPVHTRANALTYTRVRAVMIRVCVRVRYVVNECISDGWYGRADTEGLVVRLSRRRFEGVMYVNGPRVPSYRAPPFLSFRSSPTSLPRIAIDASLTPRCLTSGVRVLRDE